MRAKLSTRQVVITVAFGVTLCMLIWAGCDAAFRHTRVYATVARMATLNSAVERVRADIVSAYFVLPHGDERQDNRAKAAQGEIADATTDVNRLEALAVSDPSLKTFLPDIRLMSGALLASYRAGRGSDARPPQVYPILQRAFQSLAALQAQANTQSAGRMQLLVDEQEWNTRITSVLRGLLIVVFVVLLVDSPKYRAWPRAIALIRRRRNRRLKAQQAALLQANFTLAEINSQLAELAKTDGLTGLKNKRTFLEGLTSEFHRSVRYNKPMSLLMLDVDHFKSFNDTFGHPAGDEVLKAVARLLQTNARATDFVARYGGEEFAVILTETDMRGAQEVAERLRTAVGNHPWSERPITVSIGISSLAISTDEPMIMVREADKALYLSKQQGRNRVTCHVEAESVPINPTMP